MSCNCAVVHFRHYVELAVLIFSVNSVSAMLLPVGPNSAEVREDFLYEHALTHPVSFAGTTYSSVFVSELHHRKQDTAPMSEILYRSVSNVGTVHS